MNLPIKITFILITLLAGFYAPDAIKFLRSYEKNTIKMQNIENYCMLSTKACTQDSVEITLDKDIVKPMVTTRIKVIWHNNQAEKLTLTMKGLEGELGTIKYKLKHLGKNNYVGDITLPVCTLDEMTWLGELTDGQKTVYPALRMKS